VFQKKSVVSNFLQWLYQLLADLKNLLLIETTMNYLQNKCNIFFSLPLKTSLYYGVNMGAGRHGQGSTCPYPSKILYSVLCISSYSKTKYLCIIFTTCRQQSFPVSHRGSVPGSRSGTFIPGLLICPLLENSAGAHSCET